jgi:gluconokinase
MMNRFVVMGVCGCGKTTIGEMLSDRLGLPFVEGDTLHPRDNVDAMSRGIPLTDEMRAPWLATIADTLSSADGGMVVSCSALKQIYRDILRGGGDVFFVHLTLDFETASARVGNRPGHYMPASLVQSQFDALQDLAHGENGIALDATRDPDDIIRSVLEHVR